MWAHGKFLTDAQAQAIINKIDQKDDGKVKHKVSVAICLLLVKGLQLARVLFVKHFFTSKASLIIPSSCWWLREKFSFQTWTFNFSTCICTLCFTLIFINNNFYPNVLLQFSRQEFAIEFEIGNRYGAHII